MARYARLEIVHESTALVPTHSAAVLAVDRVDALPVDRADADGSADPSLRSRRRTHSSSTPPPDVLRCREPAPAPLTGLRSPS